MDEKIVVSCEYYNNCGLVLVLKYVLYWWRGCTVRGITINRLDCGTGF